jgi:hypothetical protein
MEFILVKPIRFSVLYCTLYPLRWIISLNLLERNIFLQIKKHYTVNSLPGQHSYWDRKKSESLPCDRNRQETCQCDAFT